MLSILKIELRFSSNTSIHFILNIVLQLKYHLILFSTLVKFEFENFRLNTKNSCNLILGLPSHVGIGRFHSPYPTHVIYPYPEKKIIWFTCENSLGNLYYKFHGDSFEINEKHFHEPELEQDTKLKEKH